MRIGTGIVLMVVGAVLRFAITLPNSFIDLGTVGAILMFGGFVTLALATFFALRPRSTVETSVRTAPGRGTHESLPPTRPYDPRQ